MNLPMPPTGFYWAKNDLTGNEWTVVKVVEEPEGGRWAEPIGYDAGCNVHEWGPRMEPPGATPLPRLTYVEAKILRGALGAALLPAPFGSEDVSRKLTSAERAQLEAAIARVTVQPGECTHEAWEWPMARCPGCGANGPRRKCRLCDDWYSGDCPAHGTIPETSP